MTSTLGDRLSAARKALGLTQEQLSETSGVPVSTIKKYEGSHREPGADALSGFARAGIDVHWLLIGEEMPPVHRATVLQQQRAQYAVDAGSRVDTELLEQVISVFYRWLDDVSGTTTIDRAKHAAIISILYAMASSKGCADKADLEQVLRAAA